MFLRVYWLDWQDLQPSALQNPLHCKKKVIDVTYQILPGRE